MMSAIRIESVSVDGQVVTATLRSPMSRQAIELPVTAIPAELRNAIAPDAWFFASVERDPTEPTGWRLMDVGSMEPLRLRIVAVCAQGHVDDDSILLGDDLHPCPVCGGERTDVNCTRNAQELGESVGRQPLEQHLATAAVTSGGGDTRYTRDRIKWLIETDRDWQTAIQRWHQVFDKLRGANLKTWAHRFSMEQFWFEGNCGGRWRGQEVMGWSGFAYLDLYASEHGLGESLDLMEKTAKAFAESWCSTVLVHAEDAAKFYGVTDVEFFVVPGTYL